MTQLAALAAVVLVAVAAGSAGGKKTYTDPRGDGPRAADIVLVHVKDDGDWIQVDLQFARDPAFHDQVQLTLLLDTTPGAGRPGDGADAVLTWNTAKDKSFRSTRWQNGRVQAVGTKGTGNGTDFGEHGGTAYLFLVQKSVWHTDHPRFAVVAQLLGKADRAPNTGYWAS